MNGPENFIQPKTPVEQLATEVDDILYEWLASQPSGRSMAVADILDAVARYEAKR